jgi:DNA-binding transcriptional regulator PaaX
LRAKGFGYLQGSVWITPDPMQGEREVLAGGAVNVESLLLLEARPCAGEKDEEIVMGAWDFAAINRGYARHLKWLEQCPQAALCDNNTAKALRRWAAEERTAWQTAVEIDPLLPKRLLPQDYLGRRAWDKRVEVLRQTARLLQSFQPKD